MAPPGLHSQTDEISSAPFGVGAVHQVILLPGVTAQSGWLGQNNESLGSASSASPRAVYHSPNIFADSQPALPTFSSKRHSFHQNATTGGLAGVEGSAITTSTAQAVDAEISRAINLTFEEEVKVEEVDSLHLDSKKPALTSQKNSSGKHLHEGNKEPALPEDSGGCLILHGRVLGAPHKSVIAYLNGCYRI